MKGLLTVALAGLTALVATTAGAGTSESFTVRRFMMSVGTNDGGADRVRLRYAARDA